MSLAQEFIGYVVGQLVTKPDRINIEIDETPRETKIILKIAKEDMGRLIGKDGRTIDAVRHLLLVMSKVHKTKFRLELIDPEE